MSVGAVLAGVGAVVGAGASIYSASQAGEGGAAPVQANPGASLNQYIKGLRKGLPNLYGLESEYRPQFGELNIADQTQYLNSILGLGGGATSAAAGQIQGAREQDYANMLGNSGSVLGILGAVDPTGKAQVDRARTMADEAYVRSQGLTPQEKRSSDQQSREAFAARGRLNDNLGVASEILGREEVLAGKRAEAQDASNNAFALSQQFSSPALGLLNQTPASVALGQDYLGSSQSIIGQNTPQLINPDAGINMGMQNASNLNAYNMAQAAQQQNQAAMWGQLGTSLINAGSSYLNRPQ